MGKTCVGVVVDIAMRVSADWKATEASKAEYLEDNGWKNNVVSANQFSDGSYVFGLGNGDFVKVEKGG